MRTDPGGEEILMKYTLQELAQIKAYWESRGYLSRFEELEEDDIDDVASEMRFNQHIQEMAKTGPIVYMNDDGLIVRRHPNGTIEHLHNK